MNLDEKFIEMEWALDDVVIAGVGETPAAMQHGNDSSNSLMSSLFLTCSLPITTTLLTTRLLN